MNDRYSHRTTGFAFGLMAVTLAVSLQSGLAAAPSGDQPAAGSTTHSHGSMQQVPRLQPKRVVTVTGNEDWEAQRGFGKDAGMAEMMTLMMVGGSGMEHMKMGPMKKGRLQTVAITGGEVATGSPNGVSQPQGLSLAVTVTPNPPVVGENTLDIAVTGANGKPAAGLGLAASVAMTSMDMGTEHPKITERGDGHYVTLVNFSMKGPWRVTLIGSAPGDRTAAAIRQALDFDVGSSQTWGQAPRSKASQPAGPQVTLSTPADTLKVGKNAIEFTILDAAGKPVTGAKVTAAVAMTNMNMGTAHPQAREGKGGRYTTMVEFSMKGPWRMTFTVAPRNQQPFTRALDFNITK